MKRILTSTILVLFTFTCIADTVESKTLKVLSIGNSFSVNAHSYLSRITTSAEDKIILGNAAIGGCTIERHWKNASTNGVSYKYKDKSLTLEEYLKAEKWDIVTIQQASGLSRFPESYEPHGQKLIAFIKEHAPQAEILVHETWAYRWDEKRLVGWQITTDEMYEQVAKTYKEFAERHGLRIIPAGDAFQLARKEYGWDDYTPADKKTGEPAKGKTLPSADGYLAGNFGLFLLGCVWYETLFGKDVRKAEFCPSAITAEEAELFREIAHKAVSGE
ncbi:MAG: DUF4886 domain-containing protein [Lentisphaerae bacterium]|nr:DUF4886 domain-containing protein [Lentisphaerota bacterium]